MRRFLALALTCLPLVCIGAPSYTSYFNNTHTYTNSTVAGTVRAGTLVSTNSVRATGAGTSGAFIGHPTTSETWWGSSDFTGVSLIDIIPSNLASFAGLYIGNYDSADSSNITTVEQLASTAQGRLSLSTSVGGPQIAAAGLITDNTGLSRLRLGGNDWDTYLSRAQAETFSINGNLGAEITVGDTTFVNMARASQTNSIGATMTIAHATNGVHGVELTHVRTFLNGSGANRTVNLPSTWHNGTGISANAFVVTNNTIVKLYVNCMGPTSTSALQTNVLASVQFYP